MCTPATIPSRIEIAQRMWKMVTDTDNLVDYVGDLLTAVTKCSESIYQGGRLYFTGWKWGYLSQYGDAGYVAQWIWALTPDEVLYLNMPSLTGGLTKQGATFNITRYVRVTGLEPEEEIKTMVADGKAKLIAMVNKYLEEQKHDGNR